MSDKHNVGLVLEKRVEVASTEVLPQVKRPHLYQVLLLNDDFTPMDFVIDVLMILFHMEQELAEQIMWKIHKEGKAVCGIYTRDIADTKATQVNEYARKHHYPLLSIIAPCKDETN